MVTLRLLLYYPSLAQKKTRMRLFPSFIAAAAVATVNGLNILVAVSLENQTPQHIF
jgi:hypothetical protein